MKLILTEFPKRTGSQFSRGLGGNTITAEFVGRSGGPPHWPFLSVIVEATTVGDAMFQTNKRYRVTIEELPDEQ